MTNVKNRNRPSCFHPSAISHSCFLTSIGLSFRRSGPGRGARRRFPSVVHLGPDQEFAAGLDQRIDVDDLPGKVSLWPRASFTPTLTGRP